MKSETVYSRLDGETESQSSTNADESNGLQHTRRSMNWRGLVVPWTAHIIFFVMYTTIMLLSRPAALFPPASGGIGRETQLATQIVKDRHPVFEDFPMDHEEIVFYEVDQGGSPYSGRPNEDTERVWDEMLDVGIVSITAEEHERFPGLTAPDRRNDGRYVVVLDMFHQLHCLRVLRNQVFEPRVRARDSPAEEWEIHMDHCVEYLRQMIMCQASTTSASMYWNPSRQTYSARFGMQRRCRNFKAIWDWANERNITGV